MRRPSRRAAQPEPTAQDAAPATHAQEPPERPGAVITFSDRIQPVLAALLLDDDVVEATAVLAARYAAEGEGLDVCLADLDEALTALRDEPADVELVRTAALSWAETTQAHYNSLTCLDPFTGLGSLQHAQAELAGLYAAAGNGRLTDPDIAESRTLVVVDVPVAKPRSRPRFGELESALRAAAVAELVAELLPEADQPAQLNPHRIAAVALRGDGLHDRLAVLARRLDARLLLSPSGGRCAVWTESLPTTQPAARHLLDELAR